MKLIQLILCLLLSVQYGQAASIVTTIKPVHSLVQNILGDTATAQLLVSNYSVHDIQLKPSHIKILQQADMIIYIDESLEGFMNKALKILPENVITIKLLAQNSLSILASRSHADWNINDADSKAKNSAAEHHLHGQIDPHIWLNPDNAIKIAKIISIKLARLYPKNARHYDTNYDLLTKKINKLKDRLSLQLNDLKQIPFIVDHDAYQYLEVFYELNSLTSISAKHSQTASIKHLIKLKEIIRENNVNCVFREPYATDKHLKILVDNTQIRIVQLDSIGADLMPGKNLYFDLMQNLSDSLTKCLGP